jgi:lysophospholipase L1-like esterase
MVGTLDFEGPSGGPALFEAGMPPTNSRAGSSRKLEIRIVRLGRCLVTGIALEKETGVVYSPIAFNGARAAWMLEVPEASFNAQLASEAPGLIMLSFGTNEANASPFLPEAYQRSLATLLTRLRTAVPNARILLAGPPDGRLRVGILANLDSVISIQQSLAARHDALFVDQRQVMGGGGSIDAWAREGLANRDLLHLTPVGYERLSVSVLRPLFPGLALALSGPVASRSVTSPRAQAVARQENDHWFYWMRAEDGRLTITDDPARYPELKIEKRSTSLSEN